MEILLVKFIEIVTQVIAHCLMTKTDALCNPVD